MARAMSVATKTSCGLARCGTANLSVLGSRENPSSQNLHEVRAGQDDAELGLQMNCEFTEIPLLNHAGLVRGITLVSPEDAARVREHNWFYNAGYAFSWTASGTKYKKINLGRFILGLSHDSPLQPDHINFDTLDNRRENLWAKERKMLHRCEYPKMNTRRG